jgi:hypothetical protein
MASGSLPRPRIPGPNTRGDETAEDGRVGIAQAISTRDKLGRSTCGEAGLKPDDRMSANVVRGISRSAERTETRRRASCEWSGSCSFPRWSYSSCVNGDELTPEERAWVAADDRLRSATEDILLWFEDLSDARIREAVKAAGGIWVSGSFGMGPRARRPGHRGCARRARARQRQRQRVELGMNASRSA